jgi:hypothetical protein
MHKGGLDYGNAFHDVESVLDAEIFGKCLFALAMSTPVWERDEDL